MDIERARVGGAHRVFAIVGWLLLLAVGLLVLVSPLVAPPWGVAVLWAAWIGAVVVSAATWRRWMFAPLVAGAAVAVFWVALLTFGDLALGWSA